ncbi:MAG: DUF4407 domain-containing protein [Nocardia sp.]|nr:DUF4407 domain-containing protein [Nocardia sp.]
MFALLTGIVLILAGAAAHWNAVVAAIVAVLAALLVGALGRALATASLSGSESGRRTRIGRIAVAVLSGLIVAELATTVLIGGTVDRVLDDRAHLDAESSQSVTTARDRFDQAVTERAELGRTITQARTDMDRALVVARCEYNPTPQCPQTEITGVPGRGPESQTAESMLGDARTRFDAAQARVQPLDERVATLRTGLDRARAAAAHTGDRGLGARWMGMNDYTTGHLGGLLLRLLVAAIFVVVALLPLLLRSWRGETSIDRAAAARAEADRAERAADTAIAVKRAQVRAETGQLHADHELAATRLGLHADTVIDREHQRKRVIAAIGGLEIGINEPQRRAVAEFEDLAALPPANPEHRDPGETIEETTVSSPRNLPAPLTPGTLTSDADAKTGGGLELPVIGTVPFSGTAARWIRPLVPGFVNDAIDRTIDTATAPLRSVRQAFEEAEEITFTVKRTRKVTVDTTDTHDPAIAASHPAQAPAYPHDSRYSALAGEHPGQWSVSPGSHHDAVATREAAGLTRPPTRELPPGGDRDR